MRTLERRTSTWMRLSACCNRARVRCPLAFLVVATSVVAVPAAAAHHRPCHRSVACTPLPCRGGIDNDGVGKVDLADPGCATADDNVETDHVPLPPTGIGFALVYADDFNGTDLAPAWVRYGDRFDWPGHEGNGLRVAHAVTVHDGIADITAREVDNVIESGAFTMKDPAYQLTYGRYETRVRVDDDPSLTTSGVALLWNVDESAHPWYEGENDFWETRTNHAAWDTFVHYGDSSSQVSCTHRETDGSLSDARVWHDIAVEWTPSRLQIFVDGLAEGSCTWMDPAVIPDWPQRLTFQLDAMDPDMGSAVVHMQVDYVRIYRLTSRSRSQRDEPPTHERVGSSQRLGPDFRTGL